MCFSAEVSYLSAAILLPAGAFAMQKAYRADVRYLPFATLPLLFGLQQLFEGLVWSGGQMGNSDWVQRYSLAYMFFSWLAWPVWVPFSAYFLEPCRQRYVYLLFSILGGMIGALQYVPYFAHDGWLVTRFFDHAISYDGKQLLDVIIGREFTYVLYLFVIIVPLVTSSVRDIKIFGYLVSLVVVVTYSFFEFAYVSVFCFGGALMSLYLVHMVSKLEDLQPAPDALPRKVASP